MVARAIQKSKSCRDEHDDGDDDGNSGPTQHAQVDSKEEYEMIVAHRKTRVNIGRGLRCSNLHLDTFMTIDEY